MIRFVRAQLGALTSSEEDHLEGSEAQMGDFAELFGEEIVLLVFSFLPVSDLHRASRVNHTWMRIALDEQLWKILCKKGGRKGVTEHMVAHYKSKKLPVPWREIYSVLHHRHQFSPTEKSEDIMLSQDDTTATAQNYLNVTVKCKDRIRPSGHHPFHYYQILVVEKKYTHMSVGITDRDWLYTGNLVGFGQNCYSYAFHSNGLILHNANSEVAKVPRYGTGDSVGLLVQYEDRTQRRPPTPTKSAHSFSLFPSSSSEEEGGCMETEKQEGGEGYLKSDRRGGSGEEEEEDEDECEDNGDDEDDDGGGKAAVPFGDVMKVLAAKHCQSDQPVTRRRKGHKLVLYLFLNGRWCYTWTDVRPPPYGEVVFTVALNGVGACVALNREEDASRRKESDGL